MPAAHARNLKCTAPFPMMVESSDAMVTVTHNDYGAFVIRHSSDYEALKEEPADSEDCMNCCWSQTRLH